jgi:hypothetical protein
MKQRAIVILGILLALQTEVLAASVSGIMIYSADDFGFPSGTVTHDHPETPEFHMWRTRAQPGRWHGLGVLPGPVPESLAARPMNFPDFSVELPLEEGVNEFTLVGEPGPITWGDDYQRFVLNLYFDGIFERPGISVLFPRFAPAQGAEPTENRSPETLYSFEVTRLSGEPAMVYDDGVVTVSVLGVSFLPPERFISVNVVDKYVLAPGGEPDGIGVMRLLVEYSGHDRPVVGPGPAAFGGPRGNIPRARLQGGGAGAPLIPAPVGRGSVPANVAGEHRLHNGETLAEVADADADPESYDEDFWVGGEGEDEASALTPEPAATPTADATAPAGTSPTARPTSAATGSVTASAGTPTPKVTPKRTPAGHEAGTSTPAPTAGKTATAPKSANSPVPTAQPD